MKLHTFVLPAAAIAATLLLAGCASSAGESGMGGMGHGQNPMTSETPAAAAAHNDADVDFSIAMLMHHEQAIEMSDMLLAKDGVDPQVVALAEKIKAAQGPEIDMMKTWLESWDVATDMTGMEGMNHGGMMPEQDMDTLAKASGADASSLFLEQMIVHHEGAITMAQTHLRNGENPDVVALADKIVTDQQTEIVTMKTLLEGL